MRQRWLRLAGAATVGIGLWAGWAQGAESNWIAAAGDWSDANNWSGGAPTSNARVNISNGGTATVSQPGEACYSLRLGSAAGESGTVDLVSGSLSTWATWSPAQLDMGGPTGLVIGYGGAGLFRHADGNNTAKHNLWLGFGPGSSGTYLLSGSGLLEAGIEHIGPVGDGYFAQTGGLNRPVNISVGPHGRYELTGGALQVTGGPDPYGQPGDGLDVGGDFALGGTGCLSASTEIISPTNGGVFTHTDGNNTVSQYLWLGQEPGSSGTYLLSGNGRLTANCEYVGWGGSGVFIQSGGVNDAGRALVVGANGGSGSYSMSGGALTTDEIGVFDGEFSITDSSASIAVGYLLISRGRFSAVPGSVIHMTRPPSWAGWGGALYNNSFDANALAGLANLRLIFENGDGNVPTFEVAGWDLGADANGFLGNFGLGTLELGAAAGVGRVVLVDLFDNQPAFGGTEALYVEGLIVNPGSELFLNGIHLYVDGTLVSAGDGGSYGGGTISEGVPEPGALCVLAAGGLALLRRRRG